MRPTITFMRDILAFLLVAFQPVRGEEDCAHVVDARASQNTVDGSWTFHATVSSTETGWDKYADEWRVQDLFGNILGTRTLLHPHENEQPFTRSLSGVVVPETVSVVKISARDSVLGYCGDSFELEIREVVLVDTDPSYNATGTSFNETLDLGSPNTEDSMHRQHPPALIIEDSLLSSGACPASNSPLITFAASVVGWSLIV